MEITIKNVDTREDICRALFKERQRQLTLINKNIKLKEDEHRFYDKEKNITITDVPTQMSYEKCDDCQFKKEFWRIGKCPIWLCQITDQVLEIDKCVKEELSTVIRPDPDLVNPNFLP